MTASAIIGQVGRSRKFRRPKTVPVHLRTAMFALIALLTLTLLGPWMTFEVARDTGNGNPIRQFGYLAITLTALAAVRPLERPDRLLVIPLVILLAVGWCWLSVAWAIAPGVALRRIILTSLIIWTCFALVNALGYERSIALVRISLVAVTIANFAAVWLDPVFGMHTSDVQNAEGSLIGDWRGVMAHKNIAGLTSALTILAFMFDRGRIPRVVQVAVIAAAAYFLWFSSSRTSLAVCIAAASLGLFYTFYKARYRGVAVGIALLLAVVVGGAQSAISDPLMRTLNDPAALTGRTQIWMALWEYHRDNPIFGSGYGSFYNIGPRSPIFVYGQDWVTAVQQGHNGFLDLLVQIGIPGLILVLVGTIALPLIRLMSRRETQGQRGALILAFMVFCLAHNGSETSLFERDTIGQVYLMLAIAMLYRLTSTEAREAMKRRSDDLFQWINNRGKRGDDAGQPAADDTEPTVPGVVTASGQTERRA